MPVLPTTKLGYTLGLKRDKNIYGQGERLSKNPFEQSRGRTRMAGDRRVDIFTRRSEEYSIQDIFPYPPRCRGLALGN